MKKFGYLVSGDEDESEALYTEAGISEAIMEMQKFGNLQQTGRFDNETLKVLLN